MAAYVTDVAYTKQDSFCSKKYSNRPNIGWDMAISRFGIKKKEFQIAISLWIKGVEFYKNMLEIVVHDDWYENHGFV